MNEAISRQRTIDGLRDYLVGKRCPDDGTLTCRLIENEVINKLPTIQSEHGTNLAEVGTDAISRQQAIDAMAELQGSTSSKGVLKGISKVWKRIEQLPPIQPEIVRCKDCKYASGNSRICLKLGHSPIGELDFCSYAERREDNESN